MSGKAQNGQIEGPESLAGGEQSLGIRDIPPQKDEGLKELSDRREELERRLNEANRDLRHAQRMLSEFDLLKNGFVSVCNQDLWPAVKSMMSSLEILLSDGERLSRSERMRLLQQMEGSGRNLQSLVGRLLDLVQTRFDRLKYDPKPIFLSQICKDAMNRIRRPLLAKGLQGKLEVIRGELRVMLDEDKGLEIMAKLLDNAVRFTPTGGRIDVVVETKGQFVVAEVRDTGPGIADDELAKILDSIGLPEEARDDGEKGPASGLAVVKRLVDLHKGSFSVKTRVGNGSSFFVSLPVTENPALLKLFGGRA